MAKKAATKKPVAVEVHPFDEMVLIGSLIGDGIIKLGSGLFRLFRLVYRVVRDGWRWVMSREVKGDGKAKGDRKKEG